MQMQMHCLVGSCCTEYTLYSMGLITGLHLLYAGALQQGGILHINIHTVQRRPFVTQRHTLSSDRSGAERFMPPATYSVVLIARNFQS